MRYVLVSVVVMMLVMVCRDGTNQRINFYLLRAFVGELHGNGDGYIFTGLERMLEVDEHQVVAFHTQCGRLFRG